MLLNFHYIPQFSYKEIVKSYPRGNEGTINFRIIIYWRINIHTSGIQQDIKNLEAHILAQIITSLSRHSI